MSVPQFEPPKWGTYATANALKSVIAGRIAVKLMC